MTIFDENIKKENIFSQEDIAANVYRCWDYKDQIISMKLIINPKTYYFYNPSRFGSDYRIDNSVFYAHHTWSFKPNSDWIFIPHDEKGLILYLILQHKLINEFYK